MKQRGVQIKCRACLTPLERSDLRYCILEMAPGRRPDSGKSMGYLCPLCFGNSAGVWDKFARISG